MAFIQHVPLLAQDSSAQALVLVEQDRPYWREIRKAQFFSLGEPLYVAKESMLQYRRAAQRSNSYLLKRYAELHAAVLSALQDIYNEEVGYHPRAAVPGFHIFEFSSKNQYPGGGLHFDLSHLHLPLLPFEQLSSSRDPHDFLSFCVPLALPKQGGGVNVWDVSYFDQKPGAYIPSIDALPEPRYHPYSVGQMTVFSGAYLHQIAPVTNADSTDRRVTLQGHCVKIDGRRIVFW